MQANASQCKPMQANASYGTVIMCAMHCGLGCFLVGSSILKLFSDPNPASGSALLIPGGFLQTLVLFFELTLGLILISNRFSRLCHIVSIVFFAILAVASFWMVTIGVSECGCFGRLAVSPLVSFVVDMFIVTLLLIMVSGFPSFPRVDRKELMSILVPIVASAIFFTVSLFVLSRVFDCELDSIQSRMMGSSVTASPSRVEIGEIEKQKLKEFYVTLRNHSKSNPRIVGGNEQLQLQSPR